MSAITTAHGELRYTALSSKVSLSVVRGRFDSALVERLIHCATAFLAEGGQGLHGFNDWEAMTDYDLRGRIDLTAFTLRHRQRFAGMHFLTGSRAVRAGVDVANFALGRFMTVYPDRRAFEAALHQRLGGVRLATAVV